MIKIALGKESFTFTIEYVLCTIRALIRDPRTSLTNISLESPQPDGTTKSVKLTQEIWQEYFLKIAGPSRDEFKRIWTTHQNVLDSRTRLHTEIKSSDGQSFKQGVSIFLRDLRHFDSNAEGRTRLEAQGNSFYVGQPYFDAEQTRIILQTRTMGGTVEDDLRRILEGKYIAHGVFLHRSRSCACFWGCFWDEVG